MVLDVNISVHLKKINKCAAIWNYRKEGGPSFQIQSVAESLVLIYSIPNILVKKKRLLLTYIFTGHAGKILNRKKKNAEGVDLPKTALPKVQTWTANCKHDHWSQVRWLLVICGHMYSGTNMDLKLSNCYGILCWCVPLIKTLV